MYALYAFCRDVDDSVDDEGLETQERLRRLGDWSRRLDVLYGGKTYGGETGDHPLFHVLAWSIPRYAMPRHAFMEIIRGMEMDIGVSVRMKDMAMLERYCDRVAGAVGVLSSHIFGDASEHAYRHAYALGRALQLTNILRDLREDGARGRLYIPLTMLAPYGLTGEALSQLFSSQHFPSIACALVSHARDAFALSDKLFWQSAHRRMWRPARFMRHVYGDILTLLCRRGWATLEPVARPTNVALAMHMARAYLLGR